MHFDWWTLTLQTVNVLILIWILSRLFFKPVLKIVAQRQDEANKILADAAAARQQAEQARTDAETAKQRVSTERDGMIAAARSDAESERTRLLEQAAGEVTKLRGDAATSIASDRATMESALIEHARGLSLDIAKRMLQRVSPAMGFEVFLKELCDQVSKMEPRLQAAFLEAAPQADAIEVVTAEPLATDQLTQVQSALEQAFGKPLKLEFRSDPDVIAGIELQSPHASVRSSWREDFERIRRELSVADTPAA